MLLLLVRLLSSAATGLWRLTGEQQLQQGSHRWWCVRGCVVFALHGGIEPPLLCWLLLLLLLLLLRLLLLLLRLLLVLLLLGLLGGQLLGLICCSA